MSISSTAIRKAGPFPGDGVTVALPFTFKVFTTADVLVVATDASGNETTLAITTNYTVSLNANQDANPGGTVTMVVAPATGTLTTIGSQVGATQPLVLTNLGGFLPTSLNDAFDRAVILVQQLLEKASRTLSLAFSTPPGVSSSLPAPVANNIFGWNATGTAIINYVAQAGTSLVALAASAGASLIGFIQAGVGAIARTMQDKGRDVICVYDFMSAAQITDAQTRAKTLDLTTALQNAATAASNRLLFVPGGTYQYSTLTLANQINIRGDGDATILYATATATDNITVTTIAPVLIENLQLSSAGAQTAGAYFKVAPAAGENALSAFRKVTFSNYFIGLKFQRASLWTVHNCYFGTAGVNGSISLQIQNDNNADSGDNNITGTTFYFSTNIGEHIRHVSGGGLRVQNNKFLFGQIHYHMSLGAAVVTSDAQIVGNSSEFAATANFLFDTTAGSTFNNIHVCDNEFTVTTGKIAIQTSTPGSTWIDGLLISANIFGSNGAATGMTIAGAGKVTLPPNIFRMAAGSIGVTIGANTNGIDIKTQSWNGITTTVNGSFTAAGVSVTNDMGVFFSIAAAGTKTITLAESITNSIANVTIGGTVQTVGVVAGFYIMTANVVTTITAIVNVAVTCSGTVITITNNTGQQFDGKILIRH